MDITFETQKGTNFTIEVGYFDTIAEVKEKVLKYQEIPISHQTLFYQGKLLTDDLDIEKSELVHRSRVRLIVGPQNEQLSSTGMPSPITQFSSPPISRRIQLLLRLSTAKITSVEIDLDDTVEKLKEKINEIEGISIPINRIALLSLGNIEMQDQKLIRDYNLMDGSEIDISVKPSTGAPTPQPTMAASSRKMRVFILPKSGTNKIMMEVNVTDKIQVIRSEMEKLKQRGGVELPTEGYFFIYKQNVMEENESFLWHRVRHGDTIEMFNGSVSGGS